MRNLRWLLTSCVLISVLLFTSVFILSTVNQQQLPLVVMTPSLRSRWKRNRYASSQQMFHHQEDDQSFEQIKGIINWDHYQDEVNQPTKMDTANKTDDGISGRKLNRDKNPSRSVRNWLQLGKIIRHSSRPATSSPSASTTNNQIERRTMKPATVSTSAVVANRYQRKVFHHYHHSNSPIPYGGYAAASNYFYDDEDLDVADTIEDRQSYGGGGGGYGCCEASSNSFQSILQALLLSILIPLALLLSLTVLYLLATALRTYSSCFIVNANGTVNGTVCSGLFGGFGSFGSLNIIGIGQQQQQEQQQQQQESSVNTNTNTIRESGTKLAAKLSSAEAALAKNTSSSSSVRNYSYVNIVPTGIGNTAPEIKPNSELFAGLPFIIFNATGLSDDEKLLFQNPINFDDLG